MQSLAIYANTAEGLRPAGPELGPRSAELVRLRAEQELEQRSVLLSMQDNAVQHKEQGNAAMEQGEWRHAVREYNQALEHAHAMMEYLEVERPPPYNGYQLRALARGQPLPKRGPAALDPFRALVHSNRSLAFLRLDAFERAEEDAAEACRLEPRYVKAWVRRAAALAAANRRDDALAVLDEALQRACGSEAAKEQVCKLIVNIRMLGPVEVKPPEKDLPVVYKDSGPRKKKPKPQREVVKVPIGMLRSSAPAEAEAEESRPRPAFVEVDRRDLDSFLQEDWHPTHLGGRWRQTRDEVTVVVVLPRRPKLSELLVQIRPQRLWVLLRKQGLTGESGQDDFDTIADESLAKGVKPSESCWILEAGGSREIHFSLQKQHAGVQLEGSDGVTPFLWDRAFELDEPVDLSEVAVAKAEKAKLARAELERAAAELRAEAARLRREGRKPEAKELEAQLAELQRQLG